MVVDVVLAWLSWGRWGAHLPVLNLCLVRLLGGPTGSDPNFQRFKEPVRALSGGQRQSVAIARAILFNAKILIMDEPTAALGPQETAQVADLIKELKKDDIGIFLISHDIHDVFDLSDRVVVMKNGQVVGSAKTEDVSKDEVLGMIILGKCPPGATPGPGAMKE